MVCQAAPLRATRPGRLAFAVLFTLGVDLQLAVALSAAFEQGARSSAKGTGAVSDKAVLLAPTPDEPLDLLDDEEVPGTSVTGAPAEMIVSIPNLTRLAESSERIEQAHAEEGGHEELEERSHEEAEAGHEEVHREVSQETADFPTGAWQNDIEALRTYPSQLRKAKQRKRTKAALLYLQLGPWPPYIKYVVRSAAANRGTTFYFLGPHFEELEECANCVWLPFDLPFAKARIETLLGIRGEELTHIYPTKLCDLKPMWPTLFPELAGLHEWIGFADHDIIFGDLDSEIEAVREDVDLLVPKGFFPQPLANGNLMLFRTTSKMLQAFKNGGNWQEVVRNHNYLGFDEWWGVKPSMMEILAEMQLGGELRAAPTLRPLLQDFTVTRPGGFFGAGVDQNATVHIYWHEGKLEAKRRGMCVCPEANSWQFAFMPLSGCSECYRQPQGGLLPEVTVNRTVDALGFHFQAWKKKKVWKECKDDCHGWMPTCRGDQGFKFGVRGFSCWWPPRSPKTTPVPAPEQEARIVRRPHAQPTDQQASQPEVNQEAMEAVTLSKVLPSVPVAAPPTEKVSNAQSSSKRSWLARLFHHEPRDVKR